MHFIHYKKLQFLLYISLLLHLEAHIIQSRENLESENEVLETDFAAVSVDESSQVRQKFTVSPIVEEGKQVTESQKDTIYDGVNFELEGKVSGDKKQANVIERKVNTAAGDVENIKTPTIVDSNRTHESADSENVGNVVSANGTVLKNVTVPVKQESQEVEHAQESLKPSTLIPSLNEQVTERVNEVDSTETYKESSVDVSENFNPDEKIANDLIQLIKQEETDIDATFQRFIKHLRCLVLVENTNFLQIHSLSNDEAFANDQKSEFMNVKTREQKAASVTNEEIDASYSAIEDISTHMTIEDSNNNEDEEEEVEYINPTETKTENHPTDIEVSDVTFSAKNEEASTLNSQSTEKITNSTLIPGRSELNGTNSVMSINFSSPGLYWNPLNFALSNQTQLLAGIAIFVLPTNVTSYANSSLLPPVPIATNTKPTQIATNTKPTQIVTNTQPTQIATNTQPTQIVRPVEPVRPINNFFNRWNFTGNLFNWTAPTVRPFNIFMPFRQQIRRQQNQNTPQQQQRSRQPWPEALPAEVKQIELDKPKTNNQNEYYDQLVGAYNNFWARLFGN